MIPSKEKHRSWPDVASSLQEAAERFREYKRRDPFPEVPAALLNSADIHDYTRATGMIHPFDRGKLKSASYEACAGAVCRFWDSEGNKKMLDLSKEKSFILPHNSIAFVTTKEKFQLPDYMAVRFNLRINLVHRGLLLGTGPLVDPGFVGHILIPLHNLTTNDYKFDYEDNLIWLEFTKISPNERWYPTHYSRVDHRGKYVDFPDDKKNKELDKYLEMSEIRSSIPKVMSDAKENAKQAEESAKRSEKISQNYTIGGAIAIAVIVVTVVLGVGSILLNVHSITGNMIRVQATTTEHVATLQSKINELKEHIGFLRTRITALEETPEEPAASKREDPNQAETETNKKIE